MTPTSRKDQKVSLLTVDRLSVYRRKLEELRADDVEFIHSHELAALVGVTPAQLRRDLASFGSYGNIARGYDVRGMSRTISQRKLRNDSAAVLREVESGQTLVITRNGTPVAELRPLGPRRFVPRELLAHADKVAPRVDAQRFRANVDAFIDQCIDD